jgi:hypothetical protein
MSYGLLWIETLGVTLLGVATAAAITGRLGRRSGERLVAIAVIIAVVIMGLCLAGVVATTAVLKFGVGVEPNWFAYALSLFVASILGMIVLLRAARRRPDPGTTMAASIWPRGRLALALAGVAAVTLVTLWRMDVQVRADAAQVRADAGAMLIAVSPPAVEADRNAAVIYEKAFALLDADPALRNPDAVFVDASTDSSGTTVRELLARQSNAIRLLREAARLPACRFEHDYTDLKVHMVVPELDSARRAANVLRLDANRAVVDGRSRDAVDDVNAMFRLSRGLCDEPTLVAGLVGMAIDQAGITTTEEILPGIKRPEDLTALKLGEAAGLRRALRHCLQAEEASGTAFLSDLAAGRVKLRPLLDGPRPGPGRATGSDVMDYPPFAVMMRVFFIRSDLRSYQQSMKTYRALAAEPYYRPETAAGVDENGRQAKHHGLLTRFLVPALNRAFEAEAQDEALHAAGQVSVAAERYRLDHGAFPPTLDALVPQYLDEVPIDPFDGGPLKSRLHGGDYLIYSVGDPQAKTGELVFTVRSSPAAASGPSTSPAEPQR